eukprot:SAG11_NODE_11883_length_733_cov_1.531546_1_plen_140_part_00
MPEAPNITLAIMCSTSYSRLIGFTEAFQPQLGSSRTKPILLYDDMSDLRSTRVAQDDSDLANALAFGEALSANKKATTGKPGAPSSSPSSLQTSSSPTHMTCDARPKTAQAGSVCDASNDAGEEQEKEDDGGSPGITVS